MLFFLIWGIISTEGAQAQQLSRTHTLPDGTAGWLSYEVKLTGKDTIKDGAFSFLATQMLAEEPDTFVSIAYNGNYAQGLKDGLWLYRRAVVTRAGVPSVQGYGLLQKLNGEEWLVQGAFEAGLASGPWTYIRRMISNGAPSDTIAHLEAIFEAGDFTGTVRGRDGAFGFEGTFASGGLLTGNWRCEGAVEEQAFVAKRKYEEGHFLEQQFALANKTFPTQKPIDSPGESQPGQWEELVLNAERASIINVNQLKGPQGTLAEKEQQIRLMQVVDRNVFEALTCFERIEGQNIWSAFEGSKGLGGPKMLLQKYPMSAMEKDALQRCIGQNSQIQLLIDSFLRDPIIDMGRFRYENVAFVYALFMEAKRSSGKLSEYLKLLSKPVYQFVDKERLLAQYAASWSFPTTVSYAFNDSVFHRPTNLEQQGSEQAASIRELENYIMQRASRLQALKMEVDEGLEQYKTESRLAEIEREVVAKRDEALALFNANKNTTAFTSYHEKFSGLVIQFVMHRFMTYARLPQQAKIDSSAAVLACFEAVVQLHEELRKQQLREESLQTMYTRTVWNAYTFTYMDELVKERLYKAYQDVLLPAITEDILANLTCEQLPEKSKYYAAVYKRMQELREMDTKAEERQIRKSVDPATFVALFGFDVKLEGSR